ncbi:MAG: chondroitinase-B domain-containing protein [Methanomassiliicoccales archaeon]
MEAQPLATIQAAVNKLQPGDTLLIRGGTYRETVTFPRSGTADKPITLKPFRDEKVIVSGCEPVTGWTLHEGSKQHNASSTSVNHHRDFQRPFQLL